MGIVVGFDYIEIAIDFAIEVIDLVLEVGLVSVGFAIVVSFLDCLFEGGYF